MKNIIICENLYEHIDSLNSMFIDMTYEDVIFGSEILNFNYIPQGLNERFKLYLNEEIEVQPNTGIFRKPNNLIHVEHFYQHCLWVCVLAYEDTTLKLWQQENVKNVFDLKQEEMEQFFLDNCGDSSKWILNSQINIKKNDFVFIRPWLWHSLEENKLVQIFLLNQTIEEE